MLDTGSERVHQIAVTLFAQTGKTDDDLTRQSPRSKGLPMRHAAPMIAALAVFAAFTPAFAQTQTEILEHIDDLGRRNEKLQERVRILENDNKALRERLRQLGAADPGPATVAPPTLPITGAPRVGEQSPASRTPPMPSPVGPGQVSLNGTIDLDSEPQGAQAATSLGSGCETPCAMEISTNEPFTVTFTHPGYAPTTVNVRMQPGQPGVSDPKFSPNPVFVQLTPQSKRKPAVSGPQQLGPAR
jgi:hypothetical protein